MTVSPNTLALPATTINMCNRISNQYTVHIFANRYMMLDFSAPCTGLLTDSHIAFNYIFQKMIFHYNCEIRAYFPLRSRSYSIVCFSLSASSEHINSVRFLFFLQSVFHFFCFRIRRNHWLSHNQSMSNKTSIRMEITSHVES